MVEARCLVDQRRRHVRGPESALYGPDAREWRGEALGKALESAPPLAGETAGDEPDPLAPLYR